MLADNTTSQVPQVARRARPAEPAAECARRARVARSRALRPHQSVGERGTYAPGHADPPARRAGRLRPGGPRAPAIRGGPTYIAETFFDPAPGCVNEERGMLGFTGTFEGRPLSVQTTGMGCPSAAIVVEELIQLGATRLVRVGTCGGAPADDAHGRHRGGRRRPRPTTARSFTYTDGEPHAPTASWTLVERGRRARPRAGRAAPRRTDRVQRGVLRPGPGPHPPLERAGSPRRRDGGRRAVHDRGPPPASRRWPSSRSATCIDGEAVDPHQRRRAEAGRRRDDDRWPAAVADRRTDRRPTSLRSGRAPSTASRSSTSSATEASILPRE